MTTATATIPSLTAAAALDGTEPVETVQISASVKTTTQDIADLAKSAASGSFTTADAKTITVVDGIITAIV